MKKFIRSKEDSKQERKNKKTKQIKTFFKMIAVNFTYH